MNLLKTLQHLGFQSEDYTISGSDFSMVQKLEQQVKTPAVYDEHGELVSEAEMEEVDVTPVKPSEVQLQSAWEEVQLKEYDIALLVNEYVKDCERDIENDCLNIVDGLLHSFSFTHIPKPSNTQLLALKLIVEVKHSQEQINKDAEEYLKSSDWLILRELDSGVQCPVEIKQLRQAARDSIVR